MPVAIPLSNPPHVPVKKALLVGISYEENANLEANGFPVQPGAHEDVTKMRKILTGKYGYKAGAIVTLVDDPDVADRQGPFWPTRENIIREMKNLVAGTQAGDHIVFAFSGHGGQVVALEEGSEEDGMDEVLLAVDTTWEADYYPDHLVNFVRDNEIRELLVKNLPDGVRCVMVFDCCHSGTASDLPTCPLSPTSPLMSPRLAPGSRAFTRMETVRDDESTTVFTWPSKGGYPPGRRNSLSVTVELNKDVTAWSACLDDQLTYGGQRGGIFMKAFVNALSRNPYPVHKDLLRTLRTEIDRVTQEQNEKRKGRSPPGTPGCEELIPPRPQLGSLYPQAALRAQFTL